MEKYELLASALILLGLLIPSACAVSISVSPTNLDPGDYVTIKIKDLEEGASFSLLIKSVFDVNPGDNFEFKVTNFNIPFGLEEGHISANTKNTDITKLTVLKDGTEYSIAGSSTDGIYSTTQTRDTSPGLYSKISVGGDALPDKSSVSANFNIEGKKTGQNTGDITFQISGIEKSTVDVICTVNSVIVTNTPISIGGGAVNTNTPTPTATTTQSSSGSSSSGGSSGGGGSLSSTTLWWTEIDSSKKSSSDSSYSNDIEGLYAQASVKGTAESVDGEFYYTGDGSSNANFGRCICSHSRRG